MKIGVVSDTHGYFDRRLEKFLAGAGLILHAGDVGDQQVLDELARIAPVQAVRGNVDSPQFALPLRTTLTVGGIQLEILHQLPAAQTELENWADRERSQGPESRGKDAFLGSFEPDTRVVISGHTHVPSSVVLAGKLFFNPGSAGKRRFSLPRCCGLFEISLEGVEATILSLEQYNKELPAKVWLAVGGKHRCGRS